ncbi:MAG: hypothetical protein ACREEM_08020 [Blastocatellia bacterium]
MGAKAWRPPAVQAVQAAPASMADFRAKAVETKVAPGRAEAPALATAWIHAAARFREEEEARTDDPVLARVGIRSAAAIHAADRGGAADRTVRAEDAAAAVHIEAASPLAMAAKVFPDRRTGPARKARHSPARATVRCG